MNRPLFYYFQLDRFLLITNATNDTIEDVQALIHNHLPLCKVYP